MTRRITRRFLCLRTLLLLLKPLVAQQSQQQGHHCKESDFQVVLIDHYGTQGETKLGHWEDEGKSPFILAKSRSPGGVGRHNFGHFQSTRSGCSCCLSSS